MEARMQRKFIRVKSNQQVRLDFGGVQYHPCRIKDMSLTGMFIFGTFDQNAGDECIIRYSETYSSSHFYFEARGCVARTTDDGLAVEFMSMHLDSYVLLQTILIYESDDPFMVGLELPEDCPYEIILPESKKSTSRCLPTLMAGYPGK